ncbi:alpha/beta fold hydrolase [Kutzneria sp. NPDC052558]|uniref:alpha/beta fold hydrolase n=1 Tax=Kutzneria sp. NPDC052558 TaxID=3364121 RepID=UPI0037CA5822
MPVTVRVGEVDIAYRETGNPDGRPVVLLHAMAGDGGTWRRLAAALAGRRVIIPDLRGHGRSSRAAGYSLPGFRDDIVGLLDELGLGQVDLVGHSLGGRVACLIAQHTPGRVRRLVLEETPPPPHEPGPPPKRSLAGLAFWPTFDRKMAGPLIAECRTPDPQWWSRLAAITAQTLLVHGGPASPVRLDHLHEMIRRLPHGRLVAIAAGHRVHSKRPAEFRDVVTPFLQSRDTW